MKDLKLAYTGGHPLQIDDINHLQTGIREALEAFAKTLVGDNSPAILWGCRVYEESGSTKVEKGLMLVDGVLMLVAAQTISGVLDEFVEYQVVEEFVSPSPVTYEDLNTHNVRRNLKVIIGRSGSRPGNFVSGFSPGIPTRVSQNWVKPTLSTNWLHRDTNSEGGDLEYTIDFLNRKVELRGCVHYDTTPGSAVLFTLPVGKRPSSQQIRQIFVSGNVSGTDFSVNSHCYCIIATNGQVSVDINAGSILGYHLDGVCFYL